MTGLDDFRQLRVGLLVPGGNTTVEPDFGTAFLPNVSIHSQRVVSSRRHEQEGYDAMDDINSSLMEAGRVLAQARVNIAVYGFTTASFYRGLNYAAQLRDSIASAVGTNAIVPSLAMLDALTALGARRVSIVTPYPAWNNEVLSAFMAETGVQVANITGDARLVDEAKMSYLWHQRPSEVVSFIRQAARRDVDAVFCPCTAWRTFEVTRVLEKELGLPVVSANQACIWLAARHIGVAIRADDGGSLFECS